MHAAVSSDTPHESSLGWHWPPGGPAQMLLGGEHVIMLTVMRWASQSHKHWCLGLNFRVSHNPETRLQAQEGQVAVGRAIESAHRPAAAVARTQRLARGGQAEQAVAQQPQAPQRQRACAGCHANILV